MYELCFPVKKDTLALYKYEKELLEFYKRYLQRLERAAAVLRPKKGDSRYVFLFFCILHLIPSQTLQPKLEIKGV